MTLTIKIYCSRQYTPKKVKIFTLTVRESNKRIVDSFKRQPNECQVLTEKFLSQQSMI
jgi:hypothetical protein